MKKLLFLIGLFALASRLQSQQSNCILKDPVVTIHFGAGNVRDINDVRPYNYRRVTSSCPSDGHYTFTSYTSDCFGGDWHTITEDFTPGDVDGNMLLVNGAWNGGEFLRTSAGGLKGGTDYEFAVSLMNVCRITKKCPFPLLPNITIRLQTHAGKPIAQINLGDIVRRESPIWSRYRTLFTMPSSETDLVLIMINNAPGGCGNDFAVDDITFRECEKQIVKTTPKIKTPPKKQPVASKTASKKTLPAVVKKDPAKQVTRPKDPTVSTAALPKSKPIIIPPPPQLANRANPLVKQIETESGDIRLDLYDNGEIDNDTVSIYHNNQLLVSKARLSQQPLTFRITVDPEHPHHELVMVAENLGSIPPNTSLMIVTAGSEKFEVFISSTKQKNAKLVFDLKTP